MRMVNGHPRRFRVNLLTPTENSIREAVGRVEDLGAHPLLTDAIVLLAAAREKVADFLELDDAAAHASQIGMAEVQMAEREE